MFVHASRHCFEEASSCVRVSWCHVTWKTSGCYGQLSMHGVVMLWLGLGVERRLTVVGLLETPPVHVCATTHECCYCRIYRSRTFSNICSESLKSVSIASTSASLGVLLRNRPKVLCARCILPGGRDGVQQQLWRRVLAIQMQMVEVSRREVLAAPKLVGAGWLCLAKVKVRKTQWCRGQAGRRPRVYVSSLSNATRAPARAGQCQLVRLPNTASSHGCRDPCDCVSCSAGEPASEK